MQEILDYRKYDPNINIAVSSSQYLSIDYVIRLRTSEGHSYELTAADYYYEALELMLIYSDNNKENEDSISKLIDDIDLFRNWIYLTLKSSKKSNNENQDYIREASIVLNTAFNPFLSGESSIKDVYGKLFIVNNNFSFKSFIDKIKSFIDDNSLNNEELKYRLNLGGCVAFAYDKENNWYFSLSGSSCDYYGNLELSKWGWGKKQTLNEAYNIIENALKEYLNKKCKVVNFNINKCHLTENTRRYVLYGDIFLSSSVTLENEVEANNAIEGLKQHYSCCERKILTYIKKNGFVNPDYLKQSANNILKNYTFIIRYDPCKKCMPALFGCGNIITGKGNRKIVKNNNVFQCKP